MQLTVFTPISHSKTTQSIIYLNSSFSALFVVADLGTSASQMTFGLIMEHYSRQTVKILMA